METPVLNGVFDRTCACVMSFDCAVKDLTEATMDNTKLWEKR